MSPFNRFVGKERGSDDICEFSYPGFWDKAGSSGIGRDPGESSRQHSASHSIKSDFCQLKLQFPYQKKLRITNCKVATKAILFCSVHKK